jgi:hypothetical protein
MSRRASRFRVLLQDRLGLDPCLVGFAAEQQESAELRRTLDVVRSELLGAEQVP